MPARSATPESGATSGVRAAKGAASGYATGRATKRAIVERAAQAFGQKGFYGTSLRSIAREAGVDHSTLLHHFGTKTALLVAVLEWHDEQQLVASAIIPRAMEGLLAGLPTEGVPFDMLGEGSPLDMVGEGLRLDALGDLPLDFSGDELPLGLTPDDVTGALIDTARHNAATPGLTQLLSTLTAEAGAEGHPARPSLQKRHDLLVAVLALAIRHHRRESRRSGQDTAVGPDAPRETGHGAPGDTTTPAGSGALESVAGAVELGPDPEMSPEDSAALILATWDGLQLYDALHPGQIDVPTLLGQTLRAAFA